MDRRSTISIDAPHVNGINRFTSHAPMRGGDQSNQLIDMTLAEVFQYGTGDAFHNGTRSGGDSTI